MGLRAQRQIRLQINQLSNLPILQQPLLPTELVILRRPLRLHIQTLFLVTPAPLPLVVAREVAGTMEMARASSLRRM